MPWKYAYHKKFIPKKVKKQPKLKREALEKIGSIISDPKRGTPLSGDLSGLYKYSYSSKPSMRIVYRFTSCNEVHEGQCTRNEIQEKCGPSSEKECEGFIFFILCRTREDLGKKYNGEKELLQAFFKKVKKK